MDLRCPDVLRGIIDLVWLLTVRSEEQAEGRCKFLNLYMALISPALTGICFYREDKTIFVLLVPCAEFAPLRRHFSASNPCASSPFRSALDECPLDIQRPGGFIIFSEWIYKNQEYRHSNLTPPRICSVHSQTRRPACHISP